MTLNTNFVRGSNPVWYFVNLVGLPFDDTYWMWTLTNTIPYIPQAVYTDINGLIPYGEPVQFLANGTLPVNLFFDDTLVYRLEFRQHVGLGPPTQADPLIYLVENYIPNGTGFVPSEAEGAVTENQISNPQFSIVNWTTPNLIISGLAGATTINIAPDWYLDLNGAGSVTLTQVPLVTTAPTPTSPTNAPYALLLNISGPWNTQPVLRQRFYENGQNWQNKYVSTSITGLILGPQQPIAATLVASNGQPMGILFNGLLTNAFTELTGFALITPFTNPNIPPAAYIDYKIALPDTADLYLTSIQVAIGNEPQAYAYEQDTINRQLDHLFHYYAPQLATKPIPSYLVGWDFALNPAQFGSTVPAFSTGANKSNYVWDQTIVFQNTNSGLNYIRTADGSLKINASVGGTSGAIIQYLSGDEVVNLLENPLCVYLQISSTAIIPVTVSLWYTSGTGLPSMGSNLSIVATLNADGSVLTTNAPTAGTWTQIPHGLLGLQQVKTSGAASTYDEFFLNNWQAVTSTISTATYFAIVVSFGALPTNTDNITFNAVSLQAGFVPTRPAPESYQQVLTDCQQYYETSYPIGGATNAVATITKLNQQVGACGLSVSDGNSVFIASAFTLNYRTLKNIATPVVKVYSPSTSGAGGAGKVDAYCKALPNAIVGPTATVLATYWNANISNVGASFTPNETGFTGGTYQSGGTNGGAGHVTYHYVVDARLGY